MKAKGGFLLREIAGSNILVPVGERVTDFNALITLNPSGKLLWERLTAGCSLDDLAEALTTNFEVAPERAAVDAGAFVAELAAKGMLDDSPA